MRFPFGTIARRSVIASVSVGLAASAIIALPAAATATEQGPGVRATAAASHSTAQEKSERQMYVFLTEYQAAVDGTGDLKTPQMVRNDYLTKDCETRLSSWEEKEKADGVFQSAELPKDFTTRYEGSGAGHATIAVTYTWDDGDTSEVWYQVQLDTLRVAQVSAAQ